MKLWIYSVLTLVIQALGKINCRLVPYQQRWTRGDRLCYCKYEDGGGGYGKVAHISCCDCGASHYFWEANGGIYGVPARPKGYKYKPRLVCDTAFASNEEKHRSRDRLGRSERR